VGAALQAAPLRPEQRAAHAPPIGPRVPGGVMVVHVLYWSLNVTKCRFLFFAHKSDIQALQSAHIPKPSKALACIITRFLYFSKDSVVYVGYPFRYAKIFHYINW